MGAVDIHMGPGVQGRAPAAGWHTLGGVSLETGEGTQESSVGRGGVQAEPWGLRHSEAQRWRRRGEMPFLWTEQHDVPCPHGAGDPPVRTGMRPQGGLLQMAGSGRGFCMGEDGGVRACLWPRGVREGEWSWKEARGWGQGNDGAGETSSWPRLTRKQGSDGSPNTGEVRTADTPEVGTHPPPPKPLPPGGICAALFPGQ